jgi:hypothetical protein
MRRFGAPGVLDKAQVDDVFKVWETKAPRESATKTMRDCQSQSKGTKNQAQPSRPVGASGEQREKREKKGKRKRVSFFVPSGLAYVALR